MSARASRRVGAYNWRPMERRREHDPPGDRARARRLTRRAALRVGAALAALGLLPSALRAASPAAGGEARAPWFSISLAQWSLHRALFSGALAHLDFAATARRAYGLEAVEYVNAFFKERAGDAAYLREMNGRAADAGVRNLLIMIDGEGELADADDAARRRAIEQHRPWLEAAAALGCHAIRVNAAGQGPRRAVAARASESLHRLGELAHPLGLSVIVENHGGLSSDGGWLAGVLRGADHPRVGSLPDFGNFRLGADERGERWYDRYRGVQQLMPFARAVSAKSHDFDARGDETRTDYERMLRIVHDAGYRGWIGIEYEGERLSEDEGIRKTLALLQRVRERLA